MHTERKSESWCGRAFLITFFIWCFIFSALELNFSMKRRQRRNRTSGHPSFIKTSVNIAGRSKDQPKITLVNHEYDGKTDFVQEGRKLIEKERIHYKTVVRYSLCSLLWVCVVFVMKCAIAQQFHFFWKKKKIFCSKKDCERLFGGISDGKQQGYHSVCSQQ